MRRWSVCHRAIDTEEVYYKVGRVNYILDNLLAQGQAEDMIVVLPYGNPYKLLPTPPEGMFGAPGSKFGSDVFSLDLNNDLMPYIESHYRTINDADHRAIGGFSRGGNQALFNGLLTSPMSMTRLPTPTVRFVCSGSVWVPTTSSMAMPETIWSSSTSTASAA